MQTNKQTDRQKNLKKDRNITEQQLFDTFEGKTLEVRNVNQKAKMFERIYFLCAKLHL